MTKQYSDLTTSEKNKISRDISFSLKHQLLLNGFPYSDDVFNSDGIHLVLFVPEGTSKTDINNAHKLGRSLRDVALASTVIIPKDEYIQLTSNKNQ